MIPVDIVKEAADVFKSYQLEEYKLLYVNKKDDIVNKIAFSCPSIPVPAEGRRTVADNSPYIASLYPPMEDWTHQQKIQFVLSQMEFFCRARGYNNETRYWKVQSLRLPYPPLPNMRHSEVTASGDYGIVVIPEQTTSLSTITRYVEETIGNTTYVYKYLKASTGDGIREEYSTHVFTLTPLGMIISQVQRKPKALAWMNIIQSPMDFLPHPLNINIHHELAPVQNKYEGLYLQVVGTNMFARLGADGLWMETSERWLDMISAKFGNNNPIGVEWQMYKSVKGVE